MEDHPINPRLIHMLLARLERISADSFWAHRASGARGSLIKLEEQMDKGAFISPKEASELMETGFTILEQAALKNKSGARQEKSL
ncbi:MAG: hypothetical protein ACYC6R_04070 [Anaerolineales bacterium]